MTPGVFLRVILMSMIHQEPPVLHRSNQENLAKSSPILKIPKPKTIYVASGTFLDVILMSMTPSGTIRNVNMLQGTIMENSAKSTQILKISKANTIYLISGIISRVILTSWTHQEAPRPSKRVRTRKIVTKFRRTLDANRTKV